MATGKKMLRSRKPAREQAEEAVSVLLRWADEDVTREGLLHTPKRVARGIHKWGVSMVTSQMMGTLGTARSTRTEFLQVPGRS